MVSVDEEEEKCNEGEVVGSVASLDVKRLGGEEVKMKQMKADELGVLVRWTTESRLGYAPVKEEERRRYSGGWSSRGGRTNVKLSVKHVCVHVFTSC